MICGTKSRTLWLSLAVLSLLSLPLSSEETYEITEAELTELETILSEQSATIEQQRNTLQALQTTISEQRSTLTALSETTETQETTISELKRSLTAYETEARKATFRVGAIGVGAGAVAGLLVALVAF